MEKSLACPEKAGPIDESTGSTPIYFLDPPGSLRQNEEQTKNSTGKLLVSMNLRGQMKSNTETSLVCRQKMEKTGERMLLEFS